MSEINCKANSEQASVAVAQLLQGVSVAGPWVSLSLLPSLSCRATTTESGSALLCGDRQTDRQTLTD